METKIMEIEKKTKEKIIFQSAVKVFLKKGYDGTRMQDIADNAKLNKSLLHYYYRSKEDLFKMVLESLLTQFISKITTIIFSNNGTERILSEISKQHNTFYRDKTRLPLFILNTMSKHPKMVIEVLDKTNIRHVTHALMGHKVSQTNLNEEQAIVWFLSFLSLKMMPLIGKDLFQYILNMDNRSYNNLTKELSKYALEILEN